jgi:hypothetical protein
LVFASRAIPQPLTAQSSESSANWQDEIFISCRSAKSLLIPAIGAVDGNAASISPAQLALDAAQDRA